MAQSWPTSTRRYLLCFDFPIILCGWMRWNNSQTSWKEKNNKTHSNIHQHCKGIPFPSLLIMQDFPYHMGWISAGGVLRCWQGANPPLCHVKCGIGLLENIGRRKIPNVSLELPPCPALGLVLPRATVWPGHRQLLAVIVPIWEHFPPSFPSECAPSSGQRSQLPPQHQDQLCCAFPGTPAAPLQHTEGFKALPW